MRSSQQPPSSSRTRFQRAGLLALLSVPVFALAGCQSIDVNAGNVATVRVIDAASDTSLPGVDIYENGTAFVYNMGFGQQTTTPIPFAPGTYRISANAHGGATTLASTNASLSNMHAYLAVFTGSLASLQASVLASQNTAAPSGQIAVRVLDEASKAAAIDVYLVPGSGKLPTTTPIATGLTLGSNSGYINIPADTYAVAVVPTGTVPTSSSVTLLTGPQVTYAAGAVRTFVLIDQQVVTSPGVQAIVVADFDVNGTTT